MAPGTVGEGFCFIVASVHVNGWDNSIQVYGEGNYGPVRASDLLMVCPDCIGYACKHCSFTGFLKCG
jgi:hypothetical protein